MDDAVIKAFEEAERWKWAATKAYLQGDNETVTEILCALSSGEALALMLSFVGEHARGVQRQCGDDALAVVEQQIAEASA